MSDKSIREMGTIRYFLHYFESTNANIKIEQKCKSEKNI